jgi:hypothetical protein
MIFMGRQEVTLLLQSANNGVNLCFHVATGIATVMVVAILPQAAAV